MLGFHFAFSYLVYPSEEFILFFFFLNQLLSVCFHLLERKERPLGWETAWHLDSTASYRQ